MSAWVVSKRHIDAIVTACRKVERAAHCELAPRITRSHADGGYHMDTRTDTELGQWLWRANMESVAARYPHRTECAVDDAAIAAYSYGSHQRTARSEARARLAQGDKDGARASLGEWTVVELIKAVHCYSYQACEVRDWEESDVKRFCDVLAAKLAYQLPGYDAAPWGIE